MVANFSTGGAAICVLSRHIGAMFEVIDVGVISDTSGFMGVIQDKSQSGTANFLTQPAMSSAALDIALKAGHSAVQRAIASGADCFIGGEMGIGNTTSASALACAFLQATAREMTGAGTGISTATLAHKIQIIDRALAHHQAEKLSDLNILATFGGYEIAALTGAYIAAAQAGLPIIVDGFISSVAVLAAYKLNTSVRDWLFFGHTSTEQAHIKILKALDGQPLLQLGMRLGEGSGAASAYTLLQLACVLHSQMATFAEAQVSTSV
jgi:nicotinate-nucleotide--dimethylbenzimidazole phosphoribosyltransferase